jgi:outer membrane protein W
MNNKYRFFVGPLAAVLMLLLSGQAAAEKGDWITRGGVANVNPDASSDILGTGP